MSCRTGLAADFDRGSVARGGVGTIQPAFPSPPLGGQTDKFRANFIFVVLDECAECDGCAGMQHREIKKCVTAQEASDRDAHCPEERERSAISTRGEKTLVSLDFRLGGGGGANPESA
jgi:hypothetical protein